MGPHLPNSYVETLTAKVMILEGGPSGGNLVEAPRWDSCPSGKKIQQSFLSLPYVNSGRGTIYKARRGSPPNLTMLAFPSWISSCRNVRNKCPFFFLFFKPPIYGILLQQPRLKHSFHRPTSNWPTGLNDSLFNLPPHFLCFSPLAF